MLRVHFLNVGDGDCTIIQHPSGRLTMVDINNGQYLDSDTTMELLQAYDMDPRAYIERVRSGTAWMTPFKERGYDIELADPVAFLRQRFPDQCLFRFIQTHPHVDHMGGLDHLVHDLERRGVSMRSFWDTTHGYTPDLQTDADTSSWDAYQRLRVSNQSPNVLRNLRDGTGHYWNQEEDGRPGGDGIDILAPTAELAAAADAGGNPNNHSYVLRISYAGKSIVLGGDAESAVWEDVYGVYDWRLKCDILKASHHGRDSGYHQPSVKAMSPTYTVVSVGKKPETDASNKYRQYSENVWSTRWKGTISFTISGTYGIQVECEYDR